MLLGEMTRRLALSAIQAEPAADPAAWRLVGLVAESALTLGLQTPMVGRDDELLAGLAAFERTVRSGQAHLLTVVGDPGIGKSRYALEFVARVNERATALTGRCLSYGEGVAFWPLREALSDGMGVESRDALRQFLGTTEDAEAVADIVATTLGFEAAEITPEQIPWAFRRLLELLSSERPVVLVIDDAHWAEPALLELIDYLADWLIAPVLLLCLARPELLDVRPGWGGGHPRVNSVVLSPLAEEDALYLLNHHAGHRVLTPEENAKILETAEGNPLFVEQLLQASSEDPWWDRERPIPATIESLLAARLDRLGPGERAYIERAALIGREFWPAAVVKLLPPEAQRSASGHLSGLVRRGFIHPDRSAIAGEEQLRFHHILIRDVAYRSTPKALRGELHEQFADWLTARGEAYDEFVGYHLDRAFRYRCEVEGIDTRARAVANRAVDSLSAAGRRALVRGDMKAAGNLLRNAADLLETSNSRRPEVLLDLGTALSESGDFSDAERVIQTVLEQAAPDATALRTRALIELSYWHSRADPTAPVDEILDVARQAIEVFKKVGDQQGLARAWLHIAWANWFRLRAAEMEAALEHALTHAERAGERRMRSDALMYLARCYVYGPRSVADALPRCSTLLERADGDVTATALINTMLAVLEAMDGRFEEARDRWRRGKQRLLDLGLNLTVASNQMPYGFVELLANRPDLAEPELSDACATFERSGDQARLSSAAAILARVLYAGGQYQRSGNYTRLAEAVASEDDIEPQIFWRGTRARILARAGQARLAEKLSDAAVALARETDFLLHYATVLSDRAEVMARLGRPDLAARDLDDALAVCDRKGIAASELAARRGLLAFTDAVVPATRGGA
ncbi:MAG: AAA family ATPase [Solirubrobacterales bacterium]|nr:AAA family ATPase [Solirubrobacterales bacterium]